MTGAMGIFAVTYGSRARKSDSNLKKFLNMFFISIQKFKKNLYFQKDCIFGTAISLLMAPRGKHARIWS
jgi:hypothetical protein